MLTVIPAYGRDYKSAKAAKADWRANRDFIIANITDPYDGKPINRSQWLVENYTSVQIRYAHLTKLTVIRK